MEKCKKRVAVRLFTATVGITFLVSCRLTPAPSFSAAAHPSFDRLTWKSGTVEISEFDRSNGNERTGNDQFPVVSNSSKQLPPQPVEHFIEVAKTGHPRILSARARVSAAASRVPQVRALDDPMLSNNFYPISNQALQTASGRAGNTLSISQKFPWPEKRWTKAAIAGREIQIARAKLAQVELEIEELVRLAYYELWFADRAIEIMEHNRYIALELVALAGARNAAGGSQQDVLRAELQLGSLDDRLIKLRLQKAVAQADLAALTQRPGLTGIEPTSDINANQITERQDKLFALAEECNPRLRERQWAVSRDHQKRRLANLGSYPDFILGTGWQTVTESDAVSPVADGHDNVSFMVGITLPLWNSRTDAAIREATAQTSASSREMNDAQDDTFRQIRRLRERARAFNEQLQIYDNRILPHAKRALKLASADYQGQLVDFGEVADGFTDVLMFELQVARTKATLAGTMAQLYRAVGCEVGTAS